MDRILRHRRPRAPGAPEGWICSVDRLGADRLPRQFQQLPCHGRVEFGRVQRGSDLLQERHSRSVPFAGVTDRSGSQWTSRSSVTRWTTNGGLFRFAMETSWSGRLPVDLLPSRAVPMIRFWARLVVINSPTHHSHAVRFSRSDHLSSLIGTSWAVWASRYCR